MVKLFGGSARSRGSIPTVVLREAVLAQRHLQSRCEGSARERIRRNTVRWGGSVREAEKLSPIVAPSA